MTAGAHDQPALPAGLRDRVLAASLRARPFGRPVPEAPAITPDEAFGRVAGALNHLLGTLSDQDWRQPALRGLTVQGLIGHLIGVERDMHRCLAGDPQVAEADHVGSTEPEAARQRGRPPAETRAQWHSAVSRTLELVRTAPDPQAQAGLHGMRLPLGDLLVARAFELWTHDNDIRAAVGQPPSDPDPSTLRLMTGLAARLLPAGAARCGLREPVSVRLVLTGPGGGTWDVPLGRGPDAASVGIVTGAAGFCRLVANRVSPDVLGPEVTGDRGQGARVLAAAAALALD